MLVDEVIEDFEVIGFLGVHMRHEGAEVRVAADEEGCLGGVDEGRSEFTGLVDAKLRETGFRFNTK